MTNKYPHFVTRESEFKPGKFTDCFPFTIFFMPDESVDRLMEIFPDGCNDDHISEYTVKINGVSIADLAHSISDDKKRHEFFDEINRLKHNKQWLRYEWGDLLHMGYHPMWDNSLKLVCGKGKIKANQDTKIVLLQTCPKRVLDLWERMKNEYIIPMREIGEKYGS